MPGLLDEVQQPVGRLSARRQLWLTAQALRMVWASARRDFCLVVAGALILGVGAGLQVMLTNNVLQSVLAAKPGSGLPSSVVAYLMALVAITAALKFTASFQNERERVVGELVARHAQTRVLDMAATMRLESFEQPEFYNRLERATMTAEIRPMQLASGLLGAISATVAVTGVLAALLAISPLPGLLLLVSAVPLWLATGRANRALYAFNFQMTHMDRARSYLGFLITSRDNAAELRACQATPFLRGRIDDLYDQRITAVRDMTRKRVRVSSLGTLANGVVVAAVMLLTVAMVAEGWMTIAETGAVLVAIALVSQKLIVAADSALLLHESILFVEDLVSFIEPGRVAPPPQTEQRTSATPSELASIELKNVDFRYPSGKTPTLHDIDMELRAGEVIALVGENGSGKTTLAKIIAGLYQATGGAVHRNGEPLTEAVTRTHRGQVAAVFQDFVQYRLSVADNIAMGRPERRDDTAAIHAAARRARAAEFIEALPEGYDTQLGSQFLGGMELSGGQWQRLALARAFFRDAELIILDEPTSALDPRAERELFDDIRELCAGRTVLVISHRFANVRSADRIYVLADGRVSEAGSHDELIKLDRRYAELFHMQASSYQTMETR
ncbi:ABC transporter ATP-binding protein [Stackebrandtia nassauensis]|uniref:ABC transporter related protein n=1 Tax=Stackebrandtia nassauensis (strain DSM 44728 / CIP 108903 / NRRL B-16338 / NBRC 102104 / LLR-40K-21) TaxID=446470 RepID=D3PVN6_STANL|nr:ABC transporter ATP-binding protein [Stackebrandtia nassauensis]ADD43150.1 ABC transporter related protein [Stackebrandtia nassauensis DSM 44728]